MAGRARSRRRSDGVDSAVLAPGVGCAGKDLETKTTRAGGRWSDVGNSAPSTGAIESWGGRPQERFSRRRTVSQALGRTGTDTELRTRRRAAAVANSHAPQVPVDLQSDPVAEPTG